MDVIKLKQPYLLFLGDAATDLDAKTATGIAHWRPEHCLGQLRLEGCGADTGLPDMTLTAAAEAGAGTFIIGVAPEGGALPDHWRQSCLDALQAGLDLASGLHSRLTEDPLLVERAQELGRRLWDLREPPKGLPCGSGQPRSGRRLLTVGNDCCVGKMFTALALERAMKAKGLRASFRATGQTGIFIAGSGICVDAVVADFISGATEILAPANEDDHWDVIEGQGSLFHPAYAGVSLGLLHGAQPDALVLCLEAGREMIDGSDPPQPLTDLAVVAETNLALARLTNPGARLLGLAVNTASLSPSEAGDYLAERSDALGLPAVDPVRNGVEELLESLT